ncbi:hypothetical protein C5167_041168 [Papaver somniferum]|uniref:Uncharacterized protein n=1 Tax=Papaver somniferum TaxID=3469 RepID=A0A4Y7IK99_PAPSO|nr:hypothetical protein C5167_041168 [Papaver somniferum]
MAGSKKIFPKSSEVADSSKGGFQFQEQQLDLLIASQRLNDFKRRADGFVQLTAHNLRPAAFGYQPTMSCLVVRRPVIR